MRTTWDSCSTQAQDAVALKTLFERHAPWLTARGS
jgi:hypothetical protein